MEEHEKNYFLPAAFVNSEEFRENPNRREILNYYKKEGRRASFEFYHILLYMSELNLNYPPVKVRFDTNEVFVHLDSDFLRSISLFDSIIDYRWETLFNKSNTSHFVINRIIRLGNSGEAQISNYFEPTSLGHTNYEFWELNVPRPIERFHEAD